MGKTQLFCHECRVPYLVLQVPLVFQREYPDVDGTKYFETWFAECKHYTKGLPPKELQNLLSWANAERPGGVIIIVSNF